jgi:hypothetical protein
MRIVHPGNEINMLHFSHLVAISRMSPPQRPQQRKGKTEFLQSFLYTCPRPHSEMIVFAIQDGRTDAMNCYMSALYQNEDER